jgi:pilus assembly protein CpaE
MDMLKRLRPNDPPPKLILNQCGVQKRPEISAQDFAEPLDIEPMAVIPFDPQLFGNAANNGRMLGEMDAKSPVVATISEIAHVLTGRAEIKVRKKPGLGSIIEKLRRAK